MTSDVRTIEGESLFDADGKLLPAEIVPEMLYALREEVFRLRAENEAFRRERDRYVERTRLLQDRVTHAIDTFTGRFSLDALDEIRTRKGLEPLRGGRR